VEEAAPEPAAPLRVDGVSHHFGGVAAVRDVTLEARPGEILGIIGPNGAGKTTLLNIMSGLVRPAQGAVYLMGERVTGWSPDRIARRGLGRTFQMAEGFGDFTVWDYLQLSRACLPDADGPPRSRRDRQAAHLAQCRFWLERNGLPEFRGHRLRDLSYGTRKIVDVCRAIACQPAVLLLDEPTSGLSVADRQVMLDQMLELKREARTVVIVDHDVGFVARVSDRVVALDQGAKIAEGTPQQVLTDQRVVTSYLGS